MICAAPIRFAWTAAITPADVGSIDESAVEPEKVALTTGEMRGTGEKPIKSEPRKNAMVFAVMRVSSRLSGRYEWALRDSKIQRQTLEKRRFPEMVAHCVAHLMLIRRFAKSLKRGILSPTMFVNPPLLNEPIPSCELT